MLCVFASVVPKLDVDVSALSDTSLKGCRLSGPNNSFVDEVLTTSSFERPEHRKRWMNKLCLQLQARTSSNSNTCTAVPLDVTWGHRLYIPSEQILSRRSIYFDLEMWDQDWQESYPWALSFPTTTAPTVSLHLFVNVDLVESLFARSCPRWQSQRSQRSQRSQYLDHRREG